MAAKNKDLVSLLDYSPEDILGILELADRLKVGRGKSEPKVMAGKSAALIFEKPSLRTRVTFEIAVYELGGHPMTISNDMIGLGKRESVSDIAKNLDRWVGLIVARTFRHETIEELAANAGVPVINALSDRSHPCQTLAFWQTLREHRRGQKKFHVAFVGDGNNVCLSHMGMAAVLGDDLTLACPQGYEPQAVELAKVREIAAKTGSKIEIVRDPAEAVKTADAIYTDVWTSMGQEKETEARRAVFASYQVNGALVGKAPAGALVSHCLPAHRGEEITDEALDGKTSIALDEAENRLHVQKAIIVKLLS